MDRGSREDGHNTHNPRAIYMYMTVAYPGFYIGGWLDSVHVKNFTTTPTLINHASSIKESAHAHNGTLVGVVYSLVCNIK